MIDRGQRAVSIFRVGRARFRCRRKADGDNEFQASISLWSLDRENWNQPTRINSSLYFTVVLLTIAPRDRTPPWKVEVTGAAHDPAEARTVLLFSTVTPSREIEARRGPFKVKTWRVW